MQTHHVCPSPVGDIDCWTFTKPELALLLSIASRDDARRNLTTVHFDGAELTAVATDGHRLLSMRQSGVSAGALSVVATITAESLAAVCKAARGKQWITIRLTRDSATAVIVDGPDPDPALFLFDGDHPLVVGRFALRRSDGFPPYQRVIPDGLALESTQGCHVSLNPTYLADLAAIAKLGVDRIDVRFMEPLDPVMIWATMETAVLTYVLMPIRPDDSGHAPRVDQAKAWRRAQEPSRRKGGKVAA